MAYATDYTTLLTGSYWSGAEVTGQPVFVTYSFDTTAPPSDTGHLAPSALATFTPFTAAQQAQTIQALNAWSSASTVPGGGSGVIFLEVPSGQGDINFAAYDFSSDPNAAGAGGEGYYPWGNWNYSTFQSGSGHFGADGAGYGNVLMNTAFETGGLFAQATVLHEIGHALGLKHPTDPWTDNVPGYIDVVHNQWDPNVAYDPNFSIMSAGASSLTDPTAADYQAIQSIYGTPAQAAEQDKSWSWNSTTWTLKQVLKPGGQTVRGASTNNLVTGGSGADTVYAIGAGTNAVYGKGGADILVGGAGLSWLDGGAGADTLNGWFGTSWASYKDARSGVVANLLSPWLSTGDAAGDSYLHISRLMGSDFADTLTADNGGDAISGGGGGDTIVGGSGNDILTGGAGADTLTGGGGNDVFAYQAIGDSTAAAADLITDWRSGDKIDVSAIDADTGANGRQHFHIAGAPAAGAIVTTYDGAHDRTVVSLYDNGSGTPDGQIWLAGQQSLTASDFVLKAPKGGAATLPFVTAAASLGASAARLDVHIETWSPRLTMLGRPPAMPA